MKQFIITFLTLMCGLSIFGQTLNTNEDSKFSLSITTYVHSQVLFTGTFKYVLEDNDLIISKTSYLSDESKILYNGKIEDDLLNKIKNIDLDNLKDFYFNECVMITSGAEYSFSITNNSITRKIHLHHYYIEKIETLIEELNKVIPEKMKIKYVSVDTKQDCK